MFSSETMKVTLDLLFNMLLFACPGSEEESYFAYCPIIRLCERKDLVRDFYEILLKEDFTVRIRDG